MKVIPNPNYRPPENPLERFRCYLCGRFIGMSEMEHDKVISEFFPDTEFNSEEMIYCHKDCEDK